MNFEERYQENYPKENTTIKKDGSQLINPSISDPQKTGFHLIHS